jgi:pilus assembly protein FimV
VYKTSLRLQALAALSLLVPWFGHAAGLGKLTVTSALGQPLSAQIELVSVNREELNTLAARLANPDAYRQANLQYPPALNSVRFAVEQPSGSQPYIKVTSSRPMNDPVVDLLVELAWANGRISRAYTALIDPPGYEQQRAASAEVAAAPVSPPVTGAIAPPVAAVEQARPSAPIRLTPPRAQAPAANQYGPIKRGETLAGVASSVKPEGVTLEQMLVGLYRSNPDAFVNNMNRMKTGRILRVPEKEEIASITPGEALKEVRVQASDWNSYRRRLADAAAAASEGSATSGRITARVDDKNAESPSRDVVRLSKGEGPGAPGATGRSGGASAADKLRALEEESVAREKALNEANERIAQLEKTIREQQRLLQLKGAPLGTQPPAAQEAPKPAATPAAPAAASAPAAEKPQAAAPSTAPDQKTAAPAAEATPKPKPKVVAPPPPPATDFMDALFEEPLYLAAGGGLLVLAGLVYVLARRRRAIPRTAAELEPVAPTFGAATASSDLFTPPEEPAIKAAAGGNAGQGEEVDALAEAEVYIAYGRDSQAEEILKDALIKNPTRQDVQLKLLEIYAARKDRTAFKDVATRLHRQTGGQGDAWMKAAAMGRGLDASEVLYGGGAIEAGAANTASVQPKTDERLDLDLNAAPAPSVQPGILAAPPVAPAGPNLTAPELPAEPAEALPAIPPEPPSEPQPQPLAPEFTLDIPPAAATDATPTPTTSESNIIDFKLELPQVDTPQATAAAEPDSAPAGDPGLDFKLDFGDINLNLEGEAPAPAVGGDKDAHWHDVQQKFDLAKAYEEMGDKEGAREVLQEVLGEGDQGQQAEAKKLLEALA